MPIRAVVYVSGAGEEIAGDKLGLSMESWIRL